MPILFLMHPNKSIYMPLPNIDVMWRVTRTIQFTMPTLVATMRIKRSVKKIRILFLTGASTTESPNS